MLKVIKESVLCQPFHLASCPPTVVRFILYSFYHVKISPNLSFGNESIMTCHIFLLSVGILSAYMYASPMFSPSVPSNLIHTNRSSYKAPCAEINFAYLCAIRIFIPFFHAALELNQLRSPGATSSIQITHPNISQVPKYSRVLPLSLCSWIITMSILGVKE